ncbi:serine/arginine repetitive matrix protein 1-like [Chrysemys picta bellii]|uniref:serine/arginine repetitive matrix protein 1-like n=1 Tax=Chrysemys picta bellii TaxID=8478 RepID=UPI0032B246E7
MTTKEVAEKIELAKLEAEENERKHQRLLQLTKLKTEQRAREEKAKKEAHKREMELKKAKEEAHKRTMELKEKEMEEREKERKHELGLAKAKQAFTPIPVPKPSTRAPSGFPETQTKVVEPDPLPTTATAVVDPIPETQPKPVPEPELATQPAPEPLPALSPALANPSTTPMPEGTSEPDLAEAADNPTQEAQPEPEIPHSAPADSGSQSMETAPAPASLPEGPSPSPQSKEELMSPASREQFQAEQEADDSLQKAWAAARSTPPPLSSSNRSRFVVEQGLLYKETLSGGHQEDWHPQRQLVVPTKYRVKLLGLAHDHPSGHSGVNRTKDRLGKSFHWEGMGKDVAKYVQSCEVCQRVGKPQDQVKAPLQPLPIIEVPFQRVAVDILGPFPKKTPRGKQYVLTFMDFATQWPEAVPLSNTRAKSVCQALTDIFARN